MIPPQFLQKSILKINVEKKYINEPYISFTEKISLQVLKTVIIKNSKVCNSILLFIINDNN